MAIFDDARTAYRKRFALTAAAVAVAASTASLIYHDQAGSYWVRILILCAVACCALPSLLSSLCGSYNGLRNSDRVEEQKPPFGSVEISQPGDAARDLAAKPRKKTVH